MGLYPSNSAYPVPHRGSPLLYKAVGCSGYARIDCFYQSAQTSPTGKQRVIIIEVNTLPGMTPATCIFHQAAECGIKPMDFVDTIVEYGFKKHARTPAVSAQKEKGNEQGIEL